MLNTIINWRLKQAHYFRETNVNLCNGMTASGSEKSSKSGKIQNETSQKKPVIQL